MCYPMNTLLAISIALLAGLLMTRIFKPIKLPSVTAYLIAGVLIGPYCLGRFGIDGLGFTSKEVVDSLSLVSEIALGFIAFSIGSEFKASELKKIGKQAVVIGIFQALAATVFVDLALLCVYWLLPGRITVAQLLTLGAIATATAPAATLMVVRQFKADGPLTRLLLPIVALDDAVGLVVFAVSFGIAKSLVVGAVDIISILVNPLLEIIFSLLLGALMGWVLTQIERAFNSNTNRLNMTIAVVALSAALSSLTLFEDYRVHITFSPLLVCMMLGTVFCNLCPLSDDLMTATDKWTSPLFALFFVVSGAELRLEVFLEVVVVGIGLVYIIFRCLGKYFGSYASAKMMGCDEKINRYLGITLFPQAGVALGMCSIALKLGEEGLLIQDITLFAILVYEIAGPLMTKWALTRAGDIKEMPDHVKHRRKHKLAAAAEKKSRDE